jgi:hypothetical protein
MLQPTLVYGPAPYLLVNPSTSVGACSGLNPYAGPYYLSTMTSQRRSIGKTMLQPLTGHRAPHYQEKLLIGIPLKTTLRSGVVLVGTLPWKPTTSTWWAQLGAMLRIAPTSTPTIGRSETSNARTLNSNIV